MSALLTSGRFFLNAYTREMRRNLEEAFDQTEKAQAFTKARILSGKNQKALFYETTSGSTGPKKQIPYTKSLQNSFSNMFALWAWDVLNHAPIKLDRGVLYMSISPGKGHQKDKDDRKYVGRLLDPVLSQFLAVSPESLRQIPPDQFMPHLALALLKRKDLEVISIWSPSYFLSLMDLIEKNADQFSFDGNWQGVWPNLKMISAWDSAQAMHSAALLKQKFPNVWFQGKGLLATEGPMTMPWEKANGKVPLLTETYFEFLDSGSNRKLLHELKEGESYEIRPSFPNGLIDYEIGDQVKVTHFYRKTPCFEFIGRGNETSDLVGEKLSGTLIRDLFQDMKLDFFTLIPKLDQYLLLWDGKNEFSNEDFENRLLKVHHYELARKINQLKPLVVKKAPGLLFEYRQQAIQNDMKMGDLKEKNIICNKELSQALEKWAAAIIS